MSWLNSGRMGWLKGLGYKGGPIFRKYFPAGRALKKKAGEQGLIRCYDHSEHPADSALMGLFLRLLSGYPLF